MLVMLLQLVRATITPGMAVQAVYTLGDHHYELVTMLSLEGVAVQGEAKGQSLHRHEFEVALARTHSA